MAAGKLDRVITLQSVVDAQDAIGGTTETWTDIDTVRANYRPTTGDELHSSRQETRIREAVFRIRWRSDLLSTKFRISYDALIWDIEQVDEIGRQRFLDIRAKVIGN